MARSKKHLYPIEVQQTANLFRSLSHPARQIILRFLIQHGTSCVTDIARNHPLSKESMTQHLNHLLDHNKLVTNYEAFPYSFYTVHTENFARSLQLLITCLTQFQMLIQQHLANEHPHHPPPNQ